MYHCDNRVICSRSGRYFRTPRRFIGLNRCCSGAILFLLLCVIYLLATKETKVPVNVELEISRLKADLIAPETVDPYTNDVLVDSFNFVIENSKLCEYGFDKTTGEEEVDMNIVVIVPSQPSHAEHRRAVRNTWASTQALNVTNTRFIVAFLIGTPVNMDMGLLKSIREENYAHGDMIMADFDDTYRNLTLKTISLLKWVTLFCSEADYVIKVDDDVLLNPRVVVKSIHEQIFELNPNSTEDHVTSVELVSHSEHLYMGLLSQGKGPIRSGRGPYGKWSVSHREYRWRMYPPYCQGPAYVMSSLTANKMYVTSKYVRTVPMEDVYVGMLALLLGIEPVNSPYYSTKRPFFNVCQYSTQLAASHSYKPGELETTWYRLVYDKVDFVPGKPCQYTTPKPVKSLNWLIGYFSSHS